jgi:hypothetical protein
MTSRLYIKTTTYRGILNMSTDEKNRTEPNLKPDLEKNETNTPGVVILQWLSYAFWGWLIISLIWLVSIVVSNLLFGGSSSYASGTIVPYAIAAAIVLLPIAFLTDLFYRKHEPVKKTGVAMVIMVIHAVLFALLTIVSLILSVFNGLNAVLENSSNINVQLIVLYTSLLATLLYAATFIRVLNPFKSKKPIVLYSLSMVGITVILLLFAIVGPFLQTLASKDDRRIEQNLPAVSRSIGTYIQDNERLPANLDDVTYEDEEAKQLIADGLVTFKPEESVTNTMRNNRVEQRYQLCVTYALADSDEYSSYSRATDDYSSFVRTNGHEKGDICYKVSEAIQPKNDLNTFAN